MKKFILIPIVLLAGCMPAKPSNAIESLGEEVIKKKEGIDIRLTPIEQEKQTNKNTNK
jgi:predicted small secreted protein